MVLGCLLPRGATNSTDSGLAAATRSEMSFWPYPRAVSRVSRQPLLSGCKSISERGAWLCQLLGRPGAQPEVAAHMRLRSDLLIVLRAAIDRWGGTRAEAAARLGIALPRLDELRRGRISRFGVGELVELAERAGVRIEVKFGAAAG